MVDFLGKLQSAYWVTPSALFHRSKSAYRLTTPLSPFWYVALLDVSKLGCKYGDRLLDLVPRGQLDPGGGVHAT